MLALVSFALALVSIGSWIPKMAYITRGSVISKGMEINIIR